jgi:hypothetical protein
MAEKLEIILDRCLDEIKKGKSIGYCLSLYPDFASELEPLLRLATDIEKLPKPEPSKEAINSTLIKIGEAIASQREKKVGKKVFYWPFMLTPTVARALAIVLVFLIAVTSMAALSTRSLPGSWLYPIKLTTEKVQFAFIRNPEGKAELRLTFADKRLSELIQTIEHRGDLDETLLRRLLQESELALDEAGPVSEERFSLFLMRLNHFHAYQQAILEQLKSKLSTQECEVLDQAISVCCERCECILNMMNPDQPGTENRCRCWTPECRCR